MLLAELSAVRGRGFAIDDQEYTPGLRCVAVPIRDHLGRVAAAMSVSIPVIRADHELMARALAALATMSLEIARRLGCAQDDPLLLALCETRRAEDALARHSDPGERRARGRTRRPDRGRDAGRSGAMSLISTGTRPGRPGGPPGALIPARSRAPFLLRLYRAWPLYLALAPTLVLNRHVYVLHNRPGRSDVLL